MDSRDDAVWEYNSDLVDSFKDQISELRYQVKKEFLDFEVVVGVSIRRIINN